MPMVEMARTAPFDEASDLLADPSLLRRRASADGYLFLPGLLNDGALPATSQAVLEVAADHGLLDGDERPIESGFLTEWQDTPRFRAYYRDILQLRAFHQLALHPAIIAVCHSLFSEPTLAHPRNILRTVFPGHPEYTTDPHQDHRPIHGSTGTWTAWIPLSDCPSELGGLALVQGSHRGGLREVPADSISLASVDRWEWRCGPMRRGDVLMFHSLTVHQARDNEKMDEIRFSCDFRYQAASSPVHEHSLLPHLRHQTWEEVYAGWPADDPLRYYWRELDLNVQLDAPSEPPADPPDDG